MDNNEDTDELALYFAAKKENEELKAKIKRLETNISSLSRFSAGMEKQLLSKFDESLDKDNEIHTLKSFIIDLDRYPKFWARSYKIEINRFIDDQGIEY